MALAILCSGQGRQRADMFALTAEAPQAQSVFLKAAELLGGVDPRHLARTASEQELAKNHTAQILCATEILATAAALGDCLADGRVIFAGYSVGEMAAWGASGRFSPERALELTDRRAKAMDAASQPGDGLIFVRGAPLPMLQSFCSDVGASIAIINPGGGYVVGGHASALERLNAKLRATSAHVVRMNVQVASHTPLLRQAADDFGAELRRAAPNPLKTNWRLLSGVDGAMVFDDREGLAKLSAQIAQTLDWAACLRSCFEAGVSGFLELGPGDALSVMAAQAYPDISSRACQQFRAMSGAQTWAKQFL